MVGQAVSREISTNVLIWFPVFAQQMSPSPFSDEGTEAQRTGCLLSVTELISSTPRTTTWVKMSLKSEFHLPSLCGGTGLFSLGRTSAP